MTAREKVILLYNSVSWGRVPVPLRPFVMTMYWSHKKLSAADRRKINNIYESVKEKQNGRPKTKRSRR